MGIVAMKFGFLVNFIFSNTDRAFLSGGVFELVIA